MMGNRVMIPMIGEGKLNRRGLVCKLSGNSRMTGSLSRKNHQDQHKHI